MNRSSSDASRTSSCMTSTPAAALASCCPWRCASSSVLRATSLVCSATCRRWRQQGRPALRQVCASLVLTQSGTLSPAASSCCPPILGCGPRFSTLTARARRVASVVSLCSTLPNSRSARSSGQRNEAEGHGPAGDRAWGLSRPSAPFIVLFAARCDFPQKVKLRRARVERCTCNWGISGLATRGGKLQRWSHLTSTHGYKHAPLHA